ncbi:MAG: histidine kinase dimerization/phosphoacceptor domain-containing protein, partial [Propionibacteriaceae bacterium]|nr:histidine kinase dimerization/phosphoacceptor domain-containing protein [Propionibacteriaceae bacterium]
MDSCLAASGPSGLSVALRPRLLELIALCCVGAAVVFDVILAVVYGRSPVAVVDTLLLLLAAFAVELKSSAWLGLAGAAITPVVAALLGQNPVDTWPWAAFVVFLATIRSVPSALAGLLMAVGNCLAIFISSGQINGSMLAAVFAPFAFAFAGATAREQRRRWEAIAQRIKLAEVARESEVRQRIALERIRIARDLHDLLGQEIVMVSLNLSAAELQITPGTEGAKAYLGAARKGIQVVLRETKRILTVLRT